MAQTPPQPQEKTPRVDSKEFYGYLFDADKSPTPVLNALLRGIANYIVRKSAIYTSNLALTILADRQFGE